MNTQKRIRKYLNRRSTVIYPPIDISKFTFEEYGDFWLSVNRLYPEKRVELQIEAFKRLPEEQLFIVGGFAEADHAAPYVCEIQRKLPHNVKLLGTVSEDELKWLYSHCKGFIITSIMEDFGMSPVEAMASGKPVVGMNKGGCVETVIDGSTGLLVNPDISEMVNAINIISKDPYKFKDKCLEHSKRFDVNIFMNNIEIEIKQQLESDC